MLEEKIAALTAAVEALTKVIQSGGVKTDAAAKPAKATKPAKVEETKVEEPVEEVRVVGVERAKVLEKLAPLPGVKKLTLQDIREVAQSCLDNDKLSGVIGINKKYGLRKIGEATEDKFADLHADLTALLNAPDALPVVQNG